MIKKGEMMRAEQSDNSILTADILKWWAQLGGVLKLMTVLFMTAIVQVFVVGIEFWMGKRFSARVGRALSLLDSDFDHGCQNCEGFFTS